MRLSESSFPAPSNQLKLRLFNNAMGSLRFSPQSTDGKSSTYDECSLARSASPSDNISTNRQQDSLAILQYLWLNTDAIFSLQAPLIREVPKTPFNFQHCLT